MKSTILSRSLNVMAMALLSVFLFSCEKEEGEGGKAKLEGRVYKIIDDGTIVMDPLGNYVFKADTMLAADQKVYIIYGGGTTDVFDDDTRTSFDGRFRFNYLREGNYTVFAYDEFASSMMSPVFREANVGSSGTTVVEDIYVRDGKNIGLSGVVGKLECSWDDNKYAPGVGLKAYVREVNGLLKDKCDVDDRGLFFFAKLRPETEYIAWGELETVKKGDVIADTIKFVTGKEGTVVNVISNPIRVTQF